MKINPRPVMIVDPAEPPMSTRPPRERPMSLADLLETKKSVMRKLDDKLDLHVGPRGGSRLIVGATGEGVALAMPWMGRPRRSGLTHEIHDRSLVFSSEQLARLARLPQYAKDELEAEPEAEPLADNEAEFHRLWDGPSWLPARRRLSYPRSAKVVVVQKKIPKPASQPLLSPPSQPRRAATMPASSMLQHASSVTQAEQARQRAQRTATLLTAPRATGDGGRSAGVMRRSQSMHATLGAGAAEQPGGRGAVDGSDNGAVIGLARRTTVGVGRTTSAGKLVSGAAASAAAEQRMGKPMGGTTSLMAAPHASNTVSRRTGPTARGLMTRADGGHVPSRAQSASLKRASATPCRQTSANRPMTAPRSPPSPTRPLSPKDRPLSPKNRPLSPKARPLSPTARSPTTRPLSPARPSSSPPQQLHEQLASPDTRSSPRSTRDADSLIAPSLRPFLRLAVTQSRLSHPQRPSSAFERLMALYPYMQAPVSPQQRDSTAHPSPPHKPSRPQSANAPTTLVATTEARLVSDESDV